MSRNIMSGNILSGYIWSGNKIEIPSSILKVESLPAAASNSINKAIMSRNGSFSKRHVSTKFEGINQGRGTVLPKSALPLHHGASKQANLKGLFPEKLPLTDTAHTKALIFLLFES